MNDKYDLVNLFFLSSIIFIPFNHIHIYHMIILY